MFDDIYTVYDRAYDATVNVEIKVFITSTIFGAMRKFSLFRINFGNKFSLPVNT